MKKNKIQKTNAMRQLEIDKINYEVHEYAWSEDQSDDEFEVPFEKIYKTWMPSAIKPVKSLHASRHLKNLI